MLDEHCDRGGVQLPRTGRMDGATPVTAERDAR